MFYKILLALIYLVVLPVGTIASLNVLFGLGIAYTAWTWLGMFFLYVVSHWLATMFSYIHGAVQEQMRVTSAMQILRQMQQENDEPDQDDTPDRPIH